MLAHILTTAFGALAASAALIPTNSSDPVNNTIDAYTDPVLMKTAANPPSNVSYAAANFTNGLRTLNGSYFHFTEMAGTVSNLTVVMIQFAFEGNLSTTNNIFAYHIHENPVAEGDNTCLSTGGHYDPFRANGTEGLVNQTNGAPSPLYHPSPANLSTFQVGDLAGKWGALTADNGTVPVRTIMEHYVRLSGDYNVVGRSVVVHDAPTDTRIACGNITQVQSLSSTGSDSSSSGNSTTGNGAMTNVASGISGLVLPLALALGTVLL